MEQNDIIKKCKSSHRICKISYHSKKKSGSLRICLDPQCLNKVILREHYYIKTIEKTSFGMSII